MPLPEFGLGAGVAHADDDDDDDDDDRRRFQPIARPPAPIPRGSPTTFESRQILAVNASPAILERAKALGFQVERNITLTALDLRVTRLRPPPRMGTASALVFLRQRIPQGQFMLNHIYRPNGGPCPVKRCYGAKLIGWQGSEQCGRGIKLGMVDTATNGRHGALRAQRLHARAFAEQGRPSSPSHGTAVAALLVGAPASGFPGLLPEAELYAADTFIGTDPTKTRTNALLLGQGLNWLLEQGVTVVNMSLAGPDNPLLREALRRFSQHQVPVIAAAGNGGPSAPPAFPAAYPETLSVTAVDHLSRSYRRANRGDYVTLAAPGVRIWTPGAKGGQYRDGTSFAAPHVTAVVALLRQQRPDLHGAALVAELQANARDLGAPGKDPVFGWGLMQNPPPCPRPETSEPARKQAGGG